MSKQKTKKLFEKRDRKFLFNKGIDAVEWEVAREQATYQTSDNKEKTVDYWDASLKFCDGHNSISLIPCMCEIDVEETIRAGEILYESLGNYIAALKETKRQGAKNKI